jgi:CRISPR-associated protein Cmr5
MKKVSAQQIKDAREILQSVNIINDNGTVSNEYRGYIASFGASISQSGLVPSVAFFENKNANSQKDRPKVMKAILLMINDKKDDYETLLDYLLDKQTDSKNKLVDIQRKIIKSAIALKLAMNTFKVEVKSDDNTN